MWHKNLTWGKIKQKAEGISLKSVGLGWKKSQLSLRTRPSSGAQWPWDMTAPAMIGLGRLTVVRLLKVNLPQQEAEDRLGCEFWRIKERTAMANYKYFCINKQTGECIQISSDSLDSALNLWQVHKEVTKSSGRKGNHGRGIRSRIYCLMQMFFLATSLQIC